MRRVVLLAGLFAAGFGVVLLAHLARDESGSPGRTGLVEDVPPGSSRPESVAEVPEGFTSPDSRRPGVRLTGWLVSPRGDRLADHRVEAHSFPWAVAPPLGTSVTTSTGWFEFEDLPGASVALAVYGPGEGDIPEFPRRPREPQGWQEAVALQMSGLEGQIQLCLLADGLQEVTLVSPRHAAFWVGATVLGIEQPPQTVLELRESDWRDHWSRWIHVDAQLEVPEDDRAERDWRDRSLGSAPLGAGLRLVLGSMAASSSEWDGGERIVVGAAVLEATRLVVQADWHRTVTRDLGPVPPGGWVEAGTLVTEPAGRLRVLLADDANGQELSDATLAASATGGGFDDSTLHVEWNEDLRAWLVRTDRSNGTCMLRAAARGYEPLEQHVELRPFLDDEIQLRLRRLPP